MSGRKPKITIGEIRNEFKLRGAELLTDEYISNHQKLEFKCSNCGNIHSIEYRNFKNGVNPNLLCKSCLKSVTIDSIRKEFKRSGAELITDTFETVDVPLLIKCANCKSEFTLSWANYKAGHNKSLLCKSCRNLIRTKTILVDGVKIEIQDTENDGKLLYKKKLDLYEKGCLFIPIYPNERDSKILQSMVDHRNKKTIHRVYARKCTLEQLDTGKEFLKANHIQGYRKADVTVGLYFGALLVSVMSFVKSRYNKEYEYELLRLATLQGYECVGGASKMFKWFVEKYKPTSIISYCDVRFCIPDPGKTVYSKLGFHFLHKSMSNYQYWSADLKKHYSRLACQKHRLKDLLVNFDPEKTEYQNMADAGFLRIYDLGNYVFGWHI